MGLPKSKYKIGDLVVIKSYPNTKPLKGDPLHIPPIMCVVGIEIENKSKKTHDLVSGEQIAERVKYSLIWFDNQKSVFVEKILYHSVLRRFNKKSYKPIKYKFGGLVKLKSKKYELRKLKESTSKSLIYDLIKGDEVSRKRKDTNVLVTYSSPDFVITGIKIVDIAEKHNDRGQLKKDISKTLIKIMWFNPYQQKYSEYEIPKECLINKKNKESTIN